MKKYLVDTSVWIEFFSDKSRLSAEFLSWLKEKITEDRVVLIQPIRAELLSGHILKRLKEQIERSFSALTKVDLDWNTEVNWDGVIDLAQVARKKGLAIPGLIDRMIIQSAIKSDVEICTADIALSKLAQAAGVNVKKLSSS